MCDGTIICICKFRLQRDRIRYTMRWYVEAVLLIKIRRTLNYSPPYILGRCYKNFLSHSPAVASVALTPACLTLGRPLCTPSDCRWPVDINYMPIVAVGSHWPLCERPSTRFVLRLCWRLLELYAFIICDDDSICDGVTCEWKFNAGFICVKCVYAFQIAPKGRRVKRWNLKLLKKWNEME